MKILMLGAGVIGITYGWQLAMAGHQVELLVRPGRLAATRRDGFYITYTDERARPAVSASAQFRPTVIDGLAGEAAYDLIVVAVRSNQVEAVLPVLSAHAGAADILFCHNCWEGDQLVKQYLAPAQYLFGFSRLVGGWRTGNRVDCILFGGPGQVSMLGEVGGQRTPRLEKLVAIFKQAGLRPETSGDMVSWLAAHYVEYLGAVGAILKAGSAERFVADRELVKQAILATREALAVCRAKGNNPGAAPMNLRMYSLPLGLIVPLGQKQYQAPSIVKFFQESIDHGLDELRAQYAAVLADGRRLGVAMPSLESFEPLFAQAETA